MDELKIQDDANEILMRRIREVLFLVRSTLDSPTVIDPKSNCRSLVKTLHEIEGILK